MMFYGYHRVSTKEQNLEPRVNEKTQYEKINVF